MASEDVTGNKSSTTSPAKSGWVSFDDTDGGDKTEGSASAVAAAANRSVGEKASPSSPSTGASSSSGVSSARGSVNSIGAARNGYDQSSPGALQVSEIQVTASEDVYLNRSMSVKKRVRV
jgi:hypothetical protein